jgi:hypothetical protein
MLEIAAVKVFSDAMPFMLMAGVGPQTVNKTRVVEAVITAVVVGIIVAYAGMYVALPVIKEQIEQLKSGQTETRQLIRDIKADLDMRGARRDALQTQTETKLIQLQIEMAKKK